MRRPLRTPPRTQALLLVLLAIGCSDPEPPPFAPGTILNPPGVGTGVGVRSDAGVTDANLPDGVVPDGLTSMGCIPVEPGDIANRVSATFEGEALEFQVRSAVAYYDATPCTGEERTLLFLLSSTNSCDIRIAPYFAVVLDARDIDVLIPVGSSLSFDFAPVSIFLVQPGATGSVTFANCDGSDGSVRFTDLNAFDGTNSFEVDGTLATCSGALNLVQVSAAFRAPLEAAFEDVCTGG